jgi:uncharacterized protein (DUF697 family)
VVGVARTLWSDFGSVWKTVREVDVSAVRREAERRVVIVCVGDRAGLRHAEQLLHEGPNRYPRASSALTSIPLDQIAQRAKTIAAADLVIVALDTGAWLTDAEAAGLQALAAIDRRARILVVFGEPHQPLPPWASRAEGGVAALVDPRAAGAAEHLAAPVLEALPAGLHLAASRRLPGLRTSVARRLTTEVSLSNASVAVASGLPSAFIALGLPIAAADTVILTKNQALMVYRLALAHGAPPEFRRRMIEITPVVGGAVVWRQVAGGLVGLVPGYGVLPKTAVAYAGTYITGRAAELWYQRGAVSKDDLGRISAEATARAKAAAAQMMARARGVKRIGRRRPPDDRD